MVRCNQYTAAASDILLIQVIPIESGMKKPEWMKYMVDATCFIVLAVNLPFAVYGYLLFGNETRGYIFENMPGTTFDNVVRLLLSIELSLTFPIVFKPATLVVEEWMETSFVFLRNKVSRFKSFHIRIPDNVIIIV